MHHPESVWEERKGNVQWQGYVFTVVARESLDFAVCSLSNGTVSKLRGCPLSTVSFTPRMGE